MRLAGSPNGLRMAPRFITRGNIVGDSNQVVLRILDAGGARTMLQGFEELRCEIEVGLHPRLCRGVRQVEVQPDELGALCRLPCRQPPDGFRKGKRCAPL